MRLGMQCEEETSESESPTLVGTTRGAPASNTRKEAPVSFYTLLTWHAVHANFYGLYQHRSMEVEEKGHRRSPRSQLHTAEASPQLAGAWHRLQEARLLCFHTGSCAFTLSCNTSQKQILGAK